MSTLSQRGLKRKTENAQQIFFIKTSALVVLLEVDTTTCMSASARGPGACTREYVHRQTKEGDKRTKQAECKLHSALKERGKSSSGTRETALSKFPLPGHHNRSPRGAALPFGFSNSAEVVY